MYKPAYFGTKPELVIKGGFISQAQMGDANASIPTPQPVISRPMFGSKSQCFQNSCVAFVSQVSIENVKQYGLSKRLEVVKNCRSVGKSSMKFNSETPEIEVDPETYVVKVDGVTIDIPVANEVCMRNFFMF